MSVKTSKTCTKSNYRCKETIWDGAGNRENDKDKLKEHIGKQVENCPRISPMRMRLKVMRRKKFIKNLFF
jgi:hypothetical protein